VTGQSFVQPQLPQFNVRISVPDITQWLAGNTGIQGFTSFAARAPGPHVALLALTHGNEISGAAVLDRLLRAGLRPARGRLTFGFVNIAAFARFDPRQPTMSRFVEEDLNRLWDIPVLDSARRSAELDRAREIRPLIDTVDVLLDLHSMLWDSDPLILCGGSDKGRRLAAGIAAPPLIVADHGHASGRRIIDYERFVSSETDAAAVLLEAGRHWEQTTIDLSLASAAGLMRHLGVAPEPFPAPYLPASVSPRLAEVTQVVTAATANFSFVRPFRGGDVIARRDTLIAVDGTAEIRTPHDDCLLVMPSLRPSRGHTAVRLARFIDP
jgi:predicted deacylase